MSVALLGAFAVALMCALWLAPIAGRVATRSLPVDDRNDERCRNGAVPQSSLCRWVGSTRRRRHVVAAVGLVGVIGFAGFAMTAAMAASAVGLRRAVALAQQRRQRRSLERELPDAIDMFVLLVHAGLTPRCAIESLARSGPTLTQSAFAHVHVRMSRGEVFGDALRSLVEELGVGAVALVELVGSSDRYGLPMATVLEQLAAETRATRRRLDEAAARALPVKLSFPLVVCTLPSFVLLAIAPAVLAALSSLGGTAW